MKKNHLIARIVLLLNSSEHTHTGGQGQTLWGRKASSVFSTQLSVSESRAKEVGHMMIPLRLNEIKE